METFHIGATAGSADTAEKLANSSSDCVHTDVTVDLEFIDVEETEDEDALEDITSTDNEKEVSSYDRNGCHVTKDRDMEVDLESQSLKNSDHSAKQPCLSSSSSPDSLATSSSISVNKMSLDHEDNLPQQRRLCCSADHLIMVKPDASFTSGHCSSALCQALFSDDVPETTTETLVSQSSYLKTKHDKENPVSRNSVEKSEKYSRRKCYDSSAALKESPTKRLLPVSKAKKGSVEKQEAERVFSSETHITANYTKFTHDSDKIQSDWKDKTKSSFCSPVTTSVQSPTSVPQPKPSFLITDILSETFAASRRSSIPGKGLSFGFQHGFPFSHPGSHFQPSESLFDDESDDHSDKYDDDDCCEEGGFVGVISL